MTRRSAPSDHDNRPSAPNVFGSPRWNTSSIVCFYRVRDRLFLERGTWRAKHNPQKYPWRTQLLARRPFKVVAIALANKMARIAWVALIDHWQSADCT
jgi:hypothetical protein